jgi:hypothetical protein
MRKYKILLVEILILSTFWFLIHTCSRKFLEPKLTPTKPVVEKIDYRDKDDTIPDLDIPKEYIDSGEVLFKNNCSSCHSFDRDLSGPKLNDSISFKYFNESVKDVTSLAKKYKHTEKLFTKWEFKFMRMPKYNEQFNNEQINYLKYYIIYSIKYKSD